MKLPQLSVFIENESGQLRDCITKLSTAGINLNALCLADSKHFGILRLITSQWEKARQILETSGYVVKVSDVLAVVIEDRPGSLSSILDLETETGLNIEYMYAFTSAGNRDAIMVICFDDLDKAVEVLENKGHTLLKRENDIFSNA